jgi:ATP-dependent RNA helicase DDX51/DBP6
LLRRVAPECRISSFTGQLNKAMREGTLWAFNEGVIDLLVCTDSAARGLDLLNVVAVINYDSPAYAKTYIHRVGRTARAGKAGTAYTLLANREAFHFKAMLEKTGRDNLPSFRMESEVFEATCALLRKTLAEFREDFH